MPTKRDIHGVLLLDKARGVSSHHALKQAQRALGASKAGHTGTLDPLATGMLPIAFGEATKLCGLGLQSDKCYRVVAQLGSRTDTLDSDGKIIAEATVPRIGSVELERALQPFRGVIEQIPPMYSALKQGGEALYLKARRGETVSRAARTVTIKHLEVLALPEPQRQTLALRIECSTGTYVRTLVDDLGLALGCGAHVIELHREWVSPFQTQPMITIEELGKHMGNSDSARWLLPPDALVQGLTRVALEPVQAERFQKGQRLADMGQDCALTAVYGLGRLLGLGLIRGGVLQVKRLLLA